METLDGIIVHPSPKNKMKSSSAGKALLLDTPGTRQEELHRKRKNNNGEEEDEKKKKKKKKRKIEAESMETSELQDSEGRGQEHEPEEAGPSSSTQDGTTGKKKKKKKKKKMEKVVVIDAADDDDDGEEEEEEGEVVSEVPVVIETSIVKKKKKLEETVVTRDDDDDDDDDDDNDNNSNDGGPNAAGVLAKYKKPNEKKKSAVVPKAVDHNSPAGHTLSEEEREPVTLGAASVQKEGKKKKRKREAQERNILRESDEYFASLAELLSYVPDIGSRSPVIICKMLRQDLPRFREFKTRGIQLRWGRFLKRENDQIKVNVANFLALTGITTANQLFYPDRHKELMEDIKKLRVVHSFQQRIAEDIPRPCFKVYTRGKKIFDDLNYMGRFTEDEDLQLQKLQRIHGNDWKTIARVLYRSTFSLEKRFNVIGATSGPWSQEEVDKLVGVMKLHLGKLARENQPGSDEASSGPDEASSGLWLTKQQLSCKLPWKFISEQMASRSWIQCREKWFLFLKPKLASFSKEVKRAGVLPKINLINTLYAMNLEDAAEIDWEQVANCLGNVMPYAAQKMFNALKITRVPHSSVLSFCELIDFLHDKVVPMLRTKLKIADSQPLQQQEAPCLYLLSDLFSNEDYMELDNTT
ncbi:hypothetical protein NHX12_029080 [Muraenolepis orangiensis]|uniref:Myb-like domain-containing protein n=1 Tax=Muraenolepis orangiensis TaxID=630683 RepID=A0A9Q0EBH2_9TELE|nr:hypothetical protein NHX12_029080 [Muraenolepis orangiensis]